MYSTLRVLNLQNNQLTSVSSIFNTTYRLSLNMLNLKENQIGFIELHSFQQLKSLNVLNLDFNQLKLVDFASFFNLDVQWVSLFFLLFFYLIYSIKSPNLGILLSKSVISFKTTIWKKKYGI